MSTVDVRGLSVSYGKFEAVRGIDLTLAPGEVVGVFGHNGAGKTSLLHSLMGLVPSVGSVHVAGTAVRRSSVASAYTAGLRLVPQSARFFAKLTVAENLELAAVGIRRGKPSSEHLDFVYELFPRLLDRIDQPAGTLSGGEGQMLAVSMGVVARPKVLMLDEPSVGLAPVLVTRLMEAIARIRELLPVGVLLVEQNVGQALTVVDRLYVLRSGRVRMQEVSTAVTAASVWDAL